MNILENAAYNAIAYEDEYCKKLDYEKTDAVIEKRITYEAARQRAEEKIALYDNVHFLYVCLVRELSIFDEEGNLRDRSHAEETVSAVLDLAEYLGHEKINDAVRKVRSTLPDLFNYFEVAKQVLAELMKLPIPQEALCALCCAWQWQKGKIKAKSLLVNTIVLRKRLFIVSWLKRTSRMSIVWSKSRCMPAWIALSKALL